MNFLEKWNKAKFNVYDSEEKTVLKLITKIGNFIGELSSGVDGKTDINGDHKGSWQGINKPTLSEEGMRGTVEKINEVDIPNINKVLNNREYVEVNLLDYGNIANVGTTNEDWSLAFNHVFTNVIKNNSGIVKWSGILKVKSTINVPYGVSLQGASLPYSGLAPASDFVGDYVIKQNSNESHIDFRNIYIAFENNPNVRGIYIANPYDYSTIDNIVGSNPNKTFLYIGNEKIGQTLRIQNVCIYAKETITEPLMCIENLQEGYICNNKFLVSGVANVNLVECDGVNTTTWINNSFANTNKRGLDYKYVKYKKRPVGNLFTGNLFENVYGDYALSIVGDTNIDNEGYNNSIMNNDYMNAASKIFINYIANSIIIDKAEVINGPNARRTFNINPYDPNAANNPYGHCMLKADGTKLVGDYKGTFEGNLTGDVNGKVTTSNLKVETGIPSNKTPFSIWWNASNEVDYGVHFDKSGVNLMKLVDNHIVNGVNGGGLRLTSSNGVTYTLQINDSGEFIKTRI